MEYLANIRDIEVRTGCPLKGFTTFRSGGNAPLLCIVNSEESLSQVLQAFSAAGQDFLVLGAGSNVLVPDRGVDLPVLKLGRGFDYIREPEPCLIEAGAATRLSRILNYCLKSGLSGLEQLCGIPASIGGLVVMNAASFGRDIFSLVSKVAVMDRTGRRLKLDRDEVSRGYRSTSLRGYIVTEVTLLLEKGADLRKKAREYFQTRLTTQDYAYPSMGCVFKNPGPASAGQLIEKCGLKGFTVGGASVSEQHANFIINRGEARTSHAAELIDIIKGKVREKYNLELEEEIIRW